MWLPVQKNTECNQAAFYLSSIHTLTPSFQNVNMRTEMTEMWFADNDYELWRQKLNFILDCLVKLLLSKLKRSFQAYNLLHLHQDNQRIKLLDHIWLFFFWSPNDYFNVYSPLWFYQQTPWQTTDSQAPQRWTSPSRDDHWWPGRLSTLLLKTNVGFKYENWVSILSANKVK